MSQTERTRPRPPAGKTFLVTRPALAAKLMEAGAAGESCKNPFSPDRSAWLFQLTPEAVATARAFYESIGKPLPKSLAAYLSRGEVSA